MKVMKFGGTSVGSIEGILQVKRIVESVNEPVVVVVSATNATTDTLISMTEDAHQGKISRLFLRHFARDIWTSYRLLFRSLN